MPDRKNALPTKYTASNIADYFIWKSAQEGKPITNKKLQKLIYYAQAWHLVFNEGKPLFNEDIEAWVHGPVVRSVYQLFKKFGFNPIISKVDKNPIEDIQEKELLDQVWKIYGTMDAEYLEMLTHREDPWQKARQGNESTERSSTVIDLGQMESFYRSKLNG